MDRRVFLAALGAAVAGCRGETDESSPSTTGSTDSSTTTSSTAVPATATNPPETTPAVDPVDALEAPPAELNDNAFDLGVASGDPSPDGAVIWTAVSTPGDAAIILVWEVAIDPEFTTLVSTELAGTTESGTVQIALAGLQPGSTYWYRFRADTQTSPVGRTKTLPAPDALPEVIRLGVSSCQNRDAGAWAAHRDIAETELDLMIWLGDYIYETDSELGTATDLASYRELHRAYRRDPHLQAAHAAHPWLAGIDDHEVVNDFDASVDPARRSDALQAWQEFIPSLTAQPTAEGLDVFRSLEFGRLLTIALVDVRQHATESSLLGERQLAWLTSLLANSAAKWKLLASPVLFGGLIGTEGLDPPLLPYSWDGYPEERAAVARLLDGGVVVSGDLHISMVLDVRANPEFTDEPVVATEFMAPPMSSQFPARLAPVMPFAGIFNPQLRQIQPGNGWLMVEITADSITATYRFVDTISDPASPVTTAAVWTLTSAGEITEQS